MDRTDARIDAPVRGDGELLEQVQRAWADVLLLDCPAEVPLDTNFLDAGGSSLLLEALCGRLRPLTSRSLTLPDLFQRGTVRAQAALLADGSGTGWRGPQ